jgi:hypothetical protein
MEKDESANMNPFNEFRRRMNLYSYIAQIVFVFLDLLIGGVSLIVAHEDGNNLLILWIALGCTLVSLIFIAVLSGLYFAGTLEERNSFGRVKAALVIRMTLRILGLATMVLFLLYLGIVKPTESGWSHFLYVYAILGLVVSGLSLLYAIWKLSWMKENPDRYHSIYEVAETQEEKKPEQDFTSKKKSGVPAKRDGAKNEIVEVESHDKK